MSRAENNTTSAYATDTTNQATIRLNFLILTATEELTKAFDSTSVSQVQIRIKHYQVRAQAWLDKGCILEGMLDAAAIETLHGEYGALAGYLLAKAWYQLG